MRVLKQLLCGAKKFYICRLHFYMTFTRHIYRISNSLHLKLCMQATGLFYDCSIVYRVETTCRMTMFNRQAIPGLNDTVFCLSLLGTRQAYPCLAALVTRQSHILITNSDHLTFFLSVYLHHLSLTGCLYVFMCVCLQTYVCLSSLSVIIVSVSKSVSQPAVY